MARLVCEQGPLAGQTFEIEGGVTIGRGTHNNIGMPKDRKASRDHAKVWKAGATQYAVADLGSTNGTLVNDGKVSRSDLKDGDMLQVGEAIFRFELGDDERPKPKATPKAESTSGGGRQDLAALLRGEESPRPASPEVSIEIKQRLLQYNKKAGGGTAATQDLGQMGLERRWLLYLLAIGAAVALFLVVQGIFSGPGDVQREGQRPAGEAGA